MVGATCKWITKCRRYGRFNPRSRGGSDFGDGVSIFIKDVSIHAPVVGATIATKAEIGSRRVSIHAPVVGATQLIMLVR